MSEVAENGPRERDWVTIALVACVVTLLGGFALKGQCLEPWDGRQWTVLCYNDLQALYDAREIVVHTFPYIYGYVADGQLMGGAIEYPVLTGLFMWASGLPVDDPNEYLTFSALLLGPFAIVAAVLLANMSGRRALMLAAAPAMILYAFHNWDLLVVAASVAGFYAWHRGRSLWAAVAFGVGGALKMYPVLFILPLAAERLFAGDRKGAWRTLWVGGLTTALINLPFAYLNPPSWWITYRFHRERGPNVDSLWGIGPSLEPSTINLLSTALMLVFFAAALWRGWKRAQEEGLYPFIPVAAALLATFLLWNKVHSPQYTLWLLPMFALVQIHWGWWAGYSIVDLVVYVGVFRYFNEFNAETSLARYAMVYGVLARAVLLGVLYVVFLRSQIAEGVGGPERAKRFLSHRPRRFASSEV